MPGKELTVEGIERGDCRLDLHHDVRAVGILLDHPLYPADLALCPPESVEKLLLLVIRPQLVAVHSLPGAAGAASCLRRFCIPICGVLQILSGHISLHACPLIRVYPLGVYVKLPGNFRE